MAAGFSASLKLTDLDDFLAPSQECIKEPPPDRLPARGTVQVDGQVPTKAAISLADCLACSGCVTSAEVMLLTTQSTDNFSSILREGQHRVVVSLSPQAVVSLAQSNGLQAQDAATHLAGFFFGLGCEAVWDTSLARSLSLLEVAREVAEKAKDTNNLPVLASACPGWVCYAEKTQPASVLQHVSRTRSPQQLMGRLVQDMWANTQHGNKVYHVTVMPCYDKKLEASRKQFEDELTANKEVDCVLTTGEVQQLLGTTPLSSVPPAPLSPLLSSGALGSHPGSSAGGYADFVLRYLATTLYDTDLPDVHWTTLRNADLQEAELKVNGEVVVRVCRAYGFRNLQNIVQKLKRGKSPYHYVEVMACPAGCLNGGGQIRSSDGSSTKQLLTELEVLYRGLPVTDPRDDVAALQIHQQMSLADPSFAHTTYKPVEKIVSALTIKW